MSEIETANHRLVQLCQIMQKAQIESGSAWPKREKSPSVAALSDDCRHFPFQLIWPAHSLIKLNPIGFTRILLALTVLSVYSTIQIFQNNEALFYSGAH